ncbi:S-type pyocin domain-containing protein [Pseudomonas sp. FP198]|uniref:S-type pyocin domain-containing protein n=1 Tax=Pseudomonas sp. FP198 TaxID=2954084 RepID=UPI0027375F36|nr:S-type pyocin domain-containing protein [Pseudomonas sp. FP198]WLG96063.1 S-type pyocin domain-containing protein [Pseudomonas sp. FP198]
MLRERIANSESIDAEYSNTFIKLTETTRQELEQIKRSALGDRQLSPFEKVITEQQATARALQAKESDYQARTTSAYSLYGQNPFFLMKELSFKKIMDSLQTSPPNIAVAYAVIDDAYRSALELKRLSLQKDILAGQLEQSSQTAEQFLTGTQAEKNNSTTTLDAKLRFINQEKNIHLQLLPEFLLKKVSSLLGVTTGLPLSQLLRNHKTIVTQIITTERTAIAAYAKANPNIKPPLSKPELEALNNLVVLQEKTKLGKRWQDYHASLLHSESVQHLTRTANTFASLIDRAQSAERVKEQLRVAAEQIEQARKQAQARAMAQQAEQERKQKIASALAGHFNELLHQFNHAQPQDVDQQLTWMRQKHRELAAAHQDATKAALSAGDLSDSSRSSSREASLRKAQADIDAVFRSKYRIENISLPTFNGAMTSARPLITAPDGLIAGYEGSPFSLQGAIDLLQKARVAVSGGPLAALGVAVSYSTPIANGELQRNPVVISIPLSQVAEELQLISGASVAHLPFRVVSSVRGEHSQFYLSPTGKNLSDKIRIRNVSLDPQTNLYTFITEGALPRTLTWTPDFPPGNNHLGSTESPATQLEIRILPGARITQIEGRADDHPACDDADIDDYVLVFPMESGIKPVYVMASRTGPRYEPGTVSGTGKTVGNDWLRATSGPNGAPIPSQIADRLRDQEMRTFDSFREKLWAAVANEPELVKQFSSRNQAIMKDGYSPYAPRNEQVGGREKFEVHHVHPIGKGGDVYDVDNMAITTPKGHINIHSKYNGEQE